MPIGMSSAHSFSKSGEGAEVLPTEVSSPVQQN